MKKITIAILLIAIYTGQIFAHSGKPDFHVIIDTDGALDDMRAISMLLAESDIRVLAITCSQGSLSPDSVYMKVNSLLSAFHHEGIAVGISEKLNNKLPKWAPFSQSVTWGKPVASNNLDFNKNTLELLNKTIQNYPHKITLIALGSLKTYADWIEANPKVSDKIERIVWYNSDMKKGFNYLVSPNSYEAIKQTGIRLDIVSNNTDKLIVNEKYFSEIYSANSIYAKLIDRVHTQNEIVERINQNHIQLWDDLVPVYLTSPFLFDSKQTENTYDIRVNKNISETYIYETIAKQLASGNETNNRVFQSFPSDPTLYKPKYAEILNLTTEKYGLIEWKAICMTNEIHGHTGIYSIIGAKMGIRALEYFNVGVNSLRATTFAGNKPPLSCFNDGIQISTGSTIGQGLISISDSVSTIPSAIFEFNNQSIKISLKPEIAIQMGKDIKYGIKEFGLLSDSYWLYIEGLAIKYWTDFDKHEIFTIELDM